MTSFLDEIAKLTGLPFDALWGAYRIYNFNGKAVYIEGAGNLLSFASERICVKAAKKMIEIKGKNLYIKRLCADDCVILGEILDISIL